MSTFWLKRKARLGTLLQSNGDEDEDGLALDRILHGQSVIAKTARTIEVDRLRFTDKDLTVIGTLEYGQLSVTDVVNCNIDGRLYVRKSIEKRFAFKSRDQCNPQLERDILLRALCTDSVWAPHLLCAFQTGTHLNLVMDYAEGGTLWDVLESNPLERICEVDLRWWLPQVISAVAWCHSQGFVHRDVKPHNFVLTRTAHVQLVDFGSAAPLVPGSRAVPPEYCRVPCGTCDYISPEILQAHEAALVAMEMPDNEDERQEENENAGEGGYGVETDWWSTGAMIYEMAYGVAPFFARDIRSTYLKIVDFRKSLTFHTNVSVSAELRDLLTHLLTDAEIRLGRHGTKEITQHPFFAGTKWETLHSERHPPDLHLPLFTYNEDLSGAPGPRLPDPMQVQEEPLSTLSGSTPFAFSAFFPPSPSEEGGDSSPGFSVLRTTKATNGTTRSILREEAESFFIGFSWGPRAVAFPDAPRMPTSAVPNTPAAAHYNTTLVQAPQTPAAAAVSVSVSASKALSSEFSTPMRRIGTLPRTIQSTLRRTRTAPRRAVSDREAMRQLVDCIGLSARKKVLAAGRTPRSNDVLALISAKNKTDHTGTDSRTKTLRFMRDDDSRSLPLLSRAAFFAAEGGGGEGGRGRREEEEGEESSDGASASDAPPSPSPSPRPGSAMSMLSRRSTTPTSTISLRLNPHPHSRPSPRPTPETPIDTGEKVLLPAVSARRRYKEKEDDEEEVSMTQPNSRSPPTGDEDDALDGLEERYHALMSDIASIEGRVDAMRRWTR